MNICTPLQAIDVKCEDQILSDNFHSNMGNYQTSKKLYPGQAGASGKTSVHHKFNSGKKPQSKFTGIKK